MICDISIQWSMISNSENDQAKCKQNHEWILVTSCWGKKIFQDLTQCGTLLVKLLIKLSEITHYLGTCICAVIKKIMK